MFVTQNYIDDSSTVNWWVRVHGSRNLLDSRGEDLGFAWAVSDEGDASCSLTVKTEVLGEGLEEADPGVLFGEEAEGGCVFLQVATGEALVCAIEGGEVTLSLDDLENLLPLVEAARDRTFGSSCLSRLTFSF